jgi:hypothetical protein
MQKTLYGKKKELSIHSKIIFQNIYSKKVKHFIQLFSVLVSFSVVTNVNLHVSIPLILTYFKYSMNHYPHFPANPKFKWYKTIHCPSKKEGF